MATKEPKNMLDASQAPPPTKRPRAKQPKRAMAVAPDAAAVLSGDLATTESGLVIPAHILDQAKAAGPGTHGHVAQRSFGEVYDPDGRRRVVITNDEMRQIDRVIQLLGTHGFGMIYACRELPESAYVNSETGEPNGRPRRCGGLMAPEGIGEQGKDEDWGYGCKCTRIHFRFHRK